MAADRMSYRVESYHPVPGSGMRASVMAGVRVTDEQTGESVTIYAKSSQVALRAKAIDLLREVQSGPPRSSDFMADKSYVRCSKCGMIGVRWPNGAVERYAVRTDCEHDWLPYDPESAPTSSDICNRCGQPISEHDKTVCTMRPSSTDAGGQ